MTLKKGDPPDPLSPAQAAEGRKSRVKHPPPRAGLAPHPVRVPRTNSPKTQLPPTRKGSRTRDSLKAAAIRALEHKGYRNLRLTDIAREAGVNISLVYHYFENKTDLIFEALHDVADICQVIEADETRPHEAFATIFHANKRFADFYRDHPGLVRSLMHFDEENPEFHELYFEFSQRWMERIAESIEKRSGDMAVPTVSAFPVAYALGSMVGQFLFALYVDRNPKLAASFPTTGEAARFLSIMWYRAIYLENPAAEALHSPL